MTKAKQDSGKSLNNLFEAINEILQSIDVAGFIEEIKRIKEERAGTVTEKDKIIKLALHLSCKEMLLDPKDVTNTKYYMNGKRTVTIGIFTLIVKDIFENEVSYQELSKKYLNNMNQANIMRYAKRCRNLNKAIKDDLTIANAINNVKESMRARITAYKQYKSL